MRFLGRVTMGCLLAATVLVLAACGSSSSSSSGGSSSGGSSSGGNAINIYSSLPLQGSAGGQSTAINNGAKLALKTAGGKVGKYTIKFVPLDDSTAAAGAADDTVTGQNARKAVQDPTAVGYIGEYNSGSSKVSLPILNKGGIAQVSPSNTNPGLTTNKPGSQPGEPDKFYPTGKRTYARVVPIDTVQGAALATVAKNDGCKAIHIWNTKTPYSDGLATNVALAAKKIGMTVEGNDGIDPKAPNYRSLAANIKAPCFIFTGEIEANGVQAVKDVGTSHPTEKIYGGDGVASNEFADPKKGLPANIASRTKLTIATLDPKSFPADGKKFISDYISTYHDKNPDPYAVYGGECMSLLLDSIKRASNGGTGPISRESVVKAMLSTKNRQSLLGTYSIDPNGDTTLTDYGLYKIAGGQLKFDQVVKAAAGG